MTSEAASASRSAETLWPVTQRADSFSSKLRPLRFRLLFGRVQICASTRPMIASLSISTAIHRMDEEAGRLAVAGRPQTAPLLAATGEIDLAGILDGKDATATTLLGRSRRQRCHDRFARNVSRRQEPVH